MAPAPEPQSPKTDQSHSVPCARPREVNRIMAELYIAFCRREEYVSAKSRSGCGSRVVALARSGSGGRVAASWDDMARRFAVPSLLLVFFGTFT